MTISRNAWLLFLLTSLFTGCQSVNQVQNNEAVFSAGPLPKSKIVEDQIANRQLSIYVPSGYSPDSSYRVIYFLDGQHLFTKGWDLQPLLDEAIEKKRLDPVLVVGIHSRADRTSEFVPYEDQWIRQNWGAYVPLASDFSELMTDQIMVYMDRKYAIVKEQKGRALFGASLGGLHALWQAGKFPGRWGMVAGISPAAWVSDYAIFATLEEADWKQTKVWLDIGTGEWNYYVPIVDILVEKRLTYGRDLFYYEVPNGRHLAADWRQRILYPMLVFAGNQNYTPISMQVIVERIPSKTSDRIFQRINPIITTENGIRFSAVSQATYTLLNPQAGSVKSDGRFEMTGKAALKVRVQYRDLQRELIINPTD